MSGKTKSHVVLQLYRKMLYSLMEVFRGDVQTFHMTRITVRREIEKRADLTDQKEIREKIIDLEEARNIIMTNGKLQEDGNYRFKAREDHIVTASVKPIPEGHNKDYESETKTETETDTSRL